MNIKEYLDKKNYEKLNFQKEMLTFRFLCKACLRPEKICFCKKINSFHTNTEICILMHPKEAKKEKVGTGRLTHLCLKNSRIIVDKNFTENDQVNFLLTSKQYNCYLLYPGAQAHNISQKPIPSLSNKNLIFVIDGTWHCAKSMMRDSKNLHNLPRISFEQTTTSKFLIKHQPAQYCLSTIESVYHLLDGLNKFGCENLNGKHQELINQLQNLVDFQINCANDPSKKSYRSGTYKSPDQRRMSKKWLDRKICYEEKNYKKIKQNLDNH